MVLLAISLIVIGVTVGLLGFQLFRVLLPVAGLVAGIIIGFTGVQGLFGTGVTATTIAVIAAVVFGLVMALLSYMFFDIALAVFLGVLFASVFALFGVALGLQENGFVVALLSVAGFIIGLLMVSSVVTSVNAVVTVSGFLGAGYILAGVFLLAGGIETQQLLDNGVLKSLAQEVGSSFFWVLIWIGGGVAFRYFQMATLRYEVYPELMYKES